MLMLPAQDPAFENQCNRLCGTCSHITYFNTHIPKINYYAYFVDVETEAQGSYLAFPLVLRSEWEDCLVSSLGLNQYFGIALRNFYMVLYF